MKSHIFKSKKTALIILFILMGLMALSGQVKKTENENSYIRLLFLKQRVLEFANKYKNQDVLVISKKEHLLYYCKNGRIVYDDNWNGFSYTFPVKVSLASKYYRTPEGEMYIDTKNHRSRYTLFLSLSYPGAYGIHGAATHLSSYLDRMEKKDPNFTFVTRKDDTRGCVAVENRVLKYLFAKVDLNTPVLIMP